MYTTKQHTFFQIMCTQTEEMLADPTFEDIELSTLLTILDQEYLQINSELDLFMALTRYAEKHDYGQSMSNRTGFFLK